MAYSLDETSVDSGNPVELYLFSYDNKKFTYTSSQYYQSVNVVEEDGTINYYTFNPDYIRRGDNLILGDSSGNIETCTITVPRTNSVALLYQGAPPELDTVRVSVYRKHGEGFTDTVRILAGTVSQVCFKGSDAELTITVESVLNRRIPRGTLSHYCQNCIYDERCTLSKAAWEAQCRVDYSIGGIDGLWVYSSDLALFPDDYFTDGYMQMGSCFRSIQKHTDRRILLKYPIPESEKTIPFTVYPGCNGLFTICADKFHNTDNFSGVPYIEPYDAFLHPVDKGAYWVDGNIVYRDTRGAVHTMQL